MTKLLFFSSLRLVRQTGLHRDVLAKG